MRINDDVTHCCDIIWIGRGERQEVLFFVSGIEMDKILDASTGLKLSSVCFCRSGLEADVNMVRVS
jgi:hypothetical protein